MGKSQLTLSVYFDVSYQLTNWSPEAMDREEGEVVCPDTIVARTNAYEILNTLGS